MIISITPYYVGQVGQKLTRWKLICTDTLAQVSASGFLNASNLMGYSVSTLDIFDVQYLYNPATEIAIYDVFIPSYSAGVLTLTADVSAGNVLLPVTDGDISIFNGTSGQIKTSGFNISNSLLSEPSSNALTAHAGGGQGSALALTKEINRVTIVATAGDSVKLPASVAGLSILIINSGANSLQVFGAGTDTINGVATATGVPQMINSAILYQCAVAGLWQAQDIGRGFSAGFPTLNYADSLTAHAGGTQAAALLLTASVNNVTIVATTGDSVKLPVSAPGLNISIINSAASNSMQVFGSGTDTINGVATATGVSQPSDTIVTYFCTLAGSWFSNYQLIANNLSASVSVSSAEFKGAFAAPKLLVSAPGANNLIMVDSMQLIMTYGTAAYAGGGVVFAQYDSTASGGGVKATNTEAASDFFSSVSAAFSFIGTSGNTVGIIPLSSSVNKGLYLSNATGAFITGDSTFVVKVFYRIVATV